MSSLADYIRWLGRFDFRTLPFGEADALVLCVLSYFDLGPAIRMMGPGETVTLADCAPALESGSVTLQITGGDMGNGEVFREAMGSRRFGSLRITDYEDVLEPETPLQFSAVTFRWESGRFAAFRGTDETIAGWEENFQISFEETEAQRRAADYAARVLAPDGGPCWLGGHSKGGNLALYAACRLPEEVWARVERVFMLDGPGLCPQVMDLSAMDRVNEKTTRIVPEFSVVGKLFEPVITDTRIVRSSASGLMQHSLATWQVAYGALDTVPENDRRSVALMDVVNRWIDSLDDAERRNVTRSLFGALSAGGAVHLGDITGDGPRSFAAVLDRLLHTDGETRRVLRELSAQLAAALRPSLPNLPSLPSLASLPSLRPSERDAREKAETL